MLNPWPFDGRKTQLNSSSEVEKYSIIASKKFDLREDKEFFDKTYG